MKVWIVSIVCSLMVGCGPSHVRVPDTTAPLQPPPESAMRACPTAENQDMGSGFVPDAADGTRGALIQAVTKAAGYGLTCVQRHDTLRQWIEDALERQRPDAE